MNDFAEQATAEQDAGSESPNEGFTNESPAQGEGGVETPLPSLSDPAFVEAAFERMAREDPDHAARLEAEWGGSGAAHENLQYAAAAYEALQSPELDDLLAGMGDSPALVEVAARIGRQMSSDGKMGQGGQSAPQESSAHDGELDRLTSAIWDARDKGDLRTVERLSRQRDRLSGRAYGGAPIVGSGFRQL